MCTKGVIDLPIEGSPEWTMLSKSLQQVHHFLEFFSAEDMQQRCWELICCAFGSDEADTWTPFDRGTMLFFYNELIKLGQSLPVLDKYLGQAFGELC